MAPFMIESEVKYVKQKSVDVINNENHEKSFKATIVWRNVVLLGAIHLGALYGAYLMIVSAKSQTVYAWYLFCLFSGKSSSSLSQFN